MIRTYRHHKIFGFLVLSGMQHGNTCQKWVKVIVWLQITFFKIKAWKSFLKYLLRRWTETEYWNILENFNSIKFFSGYTLFRICRYTKFEKQVSLKAEPNVIVVDGFSMNWLHLMFHCFPPLAATVNVYEKKQTWQKIWEIRCHRLAI